MVEEGTHPADLEVTDILLEEVEVAEEAIYLAEETEEVVDTHLVEVEVVEEAIHPAEEMGEVVDTHLEVGAVDSVVVVEVGVSEEEVVVVGEVSTDILLGDQAVARLPVPTCLRENNHFQSSSLSY